MYEENNMFCFLCSFLTGLGRWVLFWFFLTTSDALKPKTMLVYDAVSPLVKIIILFSLRNVYTVLACVI